MNDNTMMNVNTMIEQIYEAFHNGKNIPHFSENELDQTYKVFDYGDGDTENWTVRDECEQLGYDFRLYEESNSEDENRFDQHGYDEDNVNGIRKDEDEDLIINRNRYNWIHEDDDEDPEEYEDDEDDDDEDDEDETRVTAPAA